MILINLTSKTIYSGIILLVNNYHQNSKNETRPIFTMTVCLLIKNLNLFLKRSKYKLDRNQMIRGRVNE
jgi:hypothetical protein